MVGTDNQTSCPKIEDGVRENKMKVLQINTVCGRGSTGRIATDLLKCLKENGDFGKIAYGIGPMLNAESSETIEIDTKSEYYIHNFLSRFTDKEGCYSISATKRLIDQIEEYKPDIIHLHNIHGHYINYKILFNYLKKAKVPVVWTFHDCWGFTGHCSHFIMVKCEQWKTHCSYCPQLRSYPTCYTKGAVKENYNRKKACFTGLENLTIVTPSKWLAELVKESFLQDYDIRVINNGIDLTKFQPKTNTSFRIEHDLEGKIVILGVASEWSDRKGYSDFIKLSKKLSPNQKLVMVGVSDKQLKELPSSIIAIKKTNSVEELAEIYSAADVFLNFTYEDNFPTVNLEAMACGTPVITYKTGGSVEPITEETGIIIEQGNYMAALNSIGQARMLDRHIVASHAMQYSSKDKFNDYISLYKELLKGKERKV